MGYEFRIERHFLHPGVQVVECWRDGVFIATLYPHQDGIRIVSKYMTDVVREEEPVMNRSGWAPSAVVQLGKKPVSV